MEEAVAHQNTTGEDESETPFSVRIPGALIEQLALKVGDRVRLDLDAQGHLILRDAAGKVIARLLSQGDSAKKPS